MFVFLKKNLHQLAHAFIMRVCRQEQHIQDFHKETKQNQCGPRPSHEPLFLPLLLATFAAIEYMTTKVLRETAFLFMVSSGVLELEEICGAVARGVYNQQSMQVVA